MLLPGCVVRQVEAPGETGHCLQVSRPGSDAGASSIWLAAEAETEFSEWKEMLDIAANKRRSQVARVTLLFRVATQSFHQNLLCGDSGQNDMSHVDDKHLTPPVRNLVIYPNL